MDGLRGLQGRGFTPHVAIRDGRSCQRRQWTDVKGWRAAKWSYPGRGRTMILLTQLSEVIRLCGTSAVQFYSLCNFLCAALHWIIPQIVSLPILPRFGLPIHPSIHPSFDPSIQFQYLLLPELSITVVGRSFPPAVVFPFFSILLNLIYNTLTDFICISRGSLALCRLLPHLFPGVKDEDCVVIKVETHKMHTVQVCILSTYAFAIVPVKPQISNIVVGSLWSKQWHIPSSPGHVSFLFF